MNTLIKNYSEISQDGSTIPFPWNLRVIIQDDNLTYLAFNEKFQEAIFIDPVKMDLEVLASEAKRLAGYRFLAVIDTHTHADHISGASELANLLGVPLLMHEKAPSRKVSLRISGDTRIPFSSSPIEFIPSPGHTQDSLTVVWGPFVFTGDTLLYGETGRDDLPTGNGEEHYQTLLKLKARISGSQLCLPGHDGKGGRASSWKTQLELNSSFSMSLDEFMKENGNWTGPSPKLLKESLFENFK